MKQLFIIIFHFLFYTSVLCQSISNNFEFTDNLDIIWRVINNTELSFKELIESVETSGYFDNISVKDDYISCELKSYQLDYEKYGYKYMNTPFYISRNLITANIKFEFKDGRYRVTIRNILFTQNMDDTFSKQGEQHSFEWWVLNNKKKIKKNFFNPGSDIMNNDFKVKTSFFKTEENW